MVFFKTGGIHEFSNVPKVSGFVMEHVNGGSDSEEYKVAVQENCTTIPMSKGRISWHPPLVNLFKINVDDVVFSTQKAVDVGVIIRDNKGRIEATMSKKIHALLGAVGAEAKAFEVGMQFAEDNGIQDVLLEGDSLIIHCALCELSTLPSSVASIVVGIQDLYNDFRRVEFSILCSEIGE
ncbi:uncharacterized protein LOC115961234 [Quercus lobata]|uniref:uncharacterized protein LOC115961234 n=1 Tax=Quercus lobata TaxID=97700 RepID=UPI001244E101|nr:uncharacterized protein LOC115961234 [Quercus lobata]